MFGHHFALHNYACSIAIGVVSISCLELSGLSWSPSASSFSSGECGNAILQYCYGFNRHHAAVAQPLSTGSPSVSSFSSGECGNAILHYCYGFNRRQLAQGLLQSVLSLQVSAYWGNAILQYCYGFNRRQLWLSLLAQGLLQSVLSLQVSVAMSYYSIVMVSIGVSSGSVF